MTITIDEKHVPIAMTYDEISNNLASRNLGVNWARIAEKLKNTLRRNSLEDITLLCLGIGRGDTEQLLHEQEGVLVVGVDLSEGSLKGARDRDISVICADAEKLLPLIDDQSFDVIFIPKSIGYMNANQVAKHALRVLRPGDPTPKNCTLYKLSLLV